MSLSGGAERPIRAARAPGPRRRPGEIPAAGKRIARAAAAVERIARRRVEVIEIGGFALGGGEAAQDYFRDSGLLHALPGIADEPALLAHPRSGASWEAFALEQTLELAAPDEAWFWATHAGAELDLLMVKNGRRVGVEFKRMDAPRLMPSMRTAMRDLRLEALYVVYPGERRYSLADSIEAVPLKETIALEYRASRNID